MAGGELGEDGGMGQMARLCEANESHSSLLALLAIHFVAVVFELGLVGVNIAYILVLICSVATRAACTLAPIAAAATRLALREVGRVGEVPACKASRCYGKSAVIAQRAGWSVTHALADSKCSSSCRACMCLQKHMWVFFSPFLGPLRAIVNSGQHGTRSSGPVEHVVQYQLVCLLHMTQRCWLLPLKPSSLLRIRHRYRGSRKLY